MGVAQQTAFFGRPTTWTETWPYIPNLQSHPFLIKMDSNRKCCNTKNKNAMSIESDCCCYQINTDFHWLTLTPNLVKLNSESNIDVICVITDSTAVILNSPVISYSTTNLYLIFHMSSEQIYSESNQYFIYFKILFDIPFESQNFNVFFSQIKTWLIKLQGREGMWREGRKKR